MAKTKSAEKHEAAAHEPSTTANPKIAGILLLLGLLAGLGTAIGLETLAKERIEHPATPAKP